MTGKPKVRQSKLGVNDPSLCFTKLKRNERARQQVSLPKQREMMGDALIPYGSTHLQRRYG
jgi:hypothetical protein